MKWIMRYVVELKTKPTFTSSKKLQKETDFEKEVVRLMKKNKKAGYSKI